MISTDVVFAQPGSPSLLGVVALKTADVGVDPKMRKLVRLYGPDMLTYEESGATAASSPASSAENKSSRTR